LPEQSADVLYSFSSACSPHLLKPNCYYLATDHRSVAEFLNLTESAFVNLIFGSLRQTESRDAGRSSEKRVALLKAQTRSVRENRSYPYGFE
jgi:hypothetical protein